MGQIYKYVLQIHKILTQQWMWYPSINKVPEIAILFFGCQVCAAHFFETQGHRVMGDGHGKRDKKIYYCITVFGDKGN